MRRLSEEEIKKAAENARASLEIDGMFISDETFEASKKVARGEMTKKEYIEYVLKKAGVYNS